MLPVTPSMGADILNPLSEVGKVCWAEPSEAGPVIRTHGSRFANREEFQVALSHYSAFSIGGKMQSHDGLLFITESDGKKTYKPVYFSWDEKENCWTIYDGKQWSEYTLEMDKKTKPTPLYSAPQLITA